MEFIYLSIAIILIYYTLKGIIIYFRWKRYKSHIYTTQVKIAKEYGYEMSSRYIRDLVKGNIPTTFNEFVRFVRG